MATKKTITEKKRGKTIVRQKPSKPDYRTNIIVRFHDDVKLPYSADAAKYVKEYHVGPWDQLVSKHPGLLISPVFSGIDPDTLKKWISKAKEMDPTYIEGKFFQYFMVTCPVESDPQTVLKDLSGWTNIKDAYINGKTLNPSIIDPSDDPLAADQGYLFSSPDGISSRYVWGVDPPPGSAGITGSDGTGINFIDIEKGWTLDHRDLGLTAAANLLEGGTIDDASRAHGTSVLGIVGAKDNGLDCVGIAPRSNINVISYNGDTVANAIIKSLNHLGFGDVLLVEATNSENYPEGTFPPVLYSVPIETTTLEFEAIRLATALGIIVIEPGGNGYDNGTPDNYEDDTPVSLNDYTKGTKYILDPGNPGQFCDSGAIIVSAARSAMSTVSGCTDSHMIMPGAPFGDRVDCCAWGENITTLSSDSFGATTGSVNNFGSTSGAAAIIAGVVLSMQGMAQAAQGYRFSPYQMRQILRDPANGTPMARLTGDPFNPIEKKIFMPDLQKYAASCFNSKPDLYMRDSLSDDGSPHTGAMSWSPDIILKNSSVPNPTNVFGYGHGEEYNDNLSDYAYAAVDNYLYFRALNQGGIAATGAKVTAFWSNPSTVITPDSLTLIGEVGFPGPIPTAGTDIETLTVSNELIWPGSEVPVTGHYCFVAFITCDQDPYFDPKKIVVDSTTWDWDRYYHFIRNNNNVTWRNFNVVPLPPPIIEEEDTDSEAAPQQDPPQEPAPGQAPPADLPKKGWVHIDFVSPGLPGINKKMDLEIISQLPRKAIGILQAPLSWKKDVHRGSPYVRTNSKRKKCYSHFNPNSKTKIENIYFKANSKTPLRLYINVPDKLRNRNYTVAVRQMLEGVEIGRVTYMLVPWKKKLKPEKPVKPGIIGKIIPRKKLK
jgi:serine protease